jgi:hypothetical protein
MSNVAQGSNGANGSALSNGGNGASASGGGFYVAGGTLTLNKDRITENAAFGGNGGRGDSGPTGHSGGTDR